MGISKFGGPVIPFPVATLSELGALTIANLPEGSSALVNSVHDIYVLEKTSTATADGIATITASGGTGRWRRLSVPALKWQEQATWYINASTGSNENSGVDSGHAIKTFAEFKRRTGAGQMFEVKQTTDIYLETALPSTDPLDFNAKLAFGARLHIHGTQVQADTGTLTGVTARDPATNQPNVITDATQDWSTLVGKMVKFTVSGAVCWVAKDLGGGSARVSVPTIIGGYARQNLTEFVPVGNEAYVVYDPSEVYIDAGISVLGGVPEPSAYDTGFLVIDDVTIHSSGTANKEFTIVTPGIEYVIIRRCAWGFGAIVGSSHHWGCYIYGTSHTYGNTAGPRFGGCLARGNIYCHGGLLASVGIWSTGLMLQGAGLSVFNTLTVGGELSAFDVATAITIGNHAIVSVSGTHHVYGSGNTTGVLVNRKANITEPNFALWTITGTTELSIAAQATVMPTLKDYAGGALPALSALTTWAQLLAAPFSGSLFDANSGVYMGA